MGIRYSALPGHAEERAKALNELLSEKWSNLRGVAVVSFGGSSVSANPEDEKTIKELQKNAVFRNPTMAAAHLVDAQASAMKSAAANEGAGGFMAFAGMNMAQNTGGMNAHSLFSMGAQQPAQQQQHSSSSRRRRQLDMRVRRGQQGQVLHGVRRAEAAAAAGGRAASAARSTRENSAWNAPRRSRRGAAVQMRQVRLGAEGPVEAAEVLPGMRRPVRRRGRQVIDALPPRRRGNTGQQPLPRGSFPEYFDYGR